VAEAVAEKTRRRTTVYHAGLLPDQRRKAQDDFMQGRCEIVVATNAFGMGIDKADVRFVVHYNIPGSVEAYYQEAGRAGRDGAPSRCMMLFHPSDCYIQEYFIENAYPSRECVQEVYKHLCEIDENPIEMTQDELKQALGLPIGTDGIGNCEQLLEGAGVLERLIASQNQATVRIDSDVPTLVDFLPKQAKTQRKVLHAVERIVGARRQELVQFNLRDLAVNDELDQASIADALRKLNKLESFTYVPPFRGRAIRMIRRDVPFEELEIDFEALKRRKDAEYEKLDRVVDFARSTSCRQGEILRYFGEEKPDPCGRCDNCRLRGATRQGDKESGRQGDKEMPAASTSPCLPVSLSPGHPVSLSCPPTYNDDAKALLAVRMVLSGVARTQARCPCGRNLIAQMLCGSGNAKMAKLGLNKLSTYALLKHLKQEEVLSLIDALVAARCLQQTDVDRFRPVVELTEFGDEVMKGKATLRGELSLPAGLLSKLRVGQSPGDGQGGDSEKRDTGRQGDKERAGDATFPCPISVPDPQVLDALKRWRKEMAAEAGVPLHFILGNDTLAELARCRPKTREELLIIKGIGPAKAERYGIALLEIVSEADERGEGREERVEERTEKLRVDSSLLAEESKHGVDESLPSEEPRWWTVAGKQSVAKSSDHPSHYWTKRLIEAGFTVDECAAIRGLSREVVVEHARLADRES
jgi:ATP-dependent DNA helicase RecQ